MSGKIQWNDLHSFEFWFAWYFAIVLDADRPIIEALAFCRTLLKESSSPYWRKGDYYFLPYNKISHCLWGPAITEANSLQWWKYGLLDRSNGPAVECLTGAHQWLMYVPGVQLEGNPGSKFWLRAGKFHRDNGPAIEHENGCQQWWNHGTLERLITPCAEAYYEPCTKVCTHRILARFSIRLCMRTYVGHRINAPARIVWYMDKSGKRITDNYWIIHGRLHRLDGPAVESSSADKNEWWINGRKWSQEQFLKRVAKPCRRAPKRQKIQAD